MGNRTCSGHPATGYSPSSAEYLLARQRASYLIHCFLLLAPSSGLPISLGPRQSSSNCSNGSGNTNLAGVASDPEHVSWCCPPMVLDSAAQTQHEGASSVGMLSPPTPAPRPSPVCTVKSPSGILEVFSVCLDTPLMSRYRYLPVSHLPQH
jgi:hypothetical protein